MSRTRRQLERKAARDIPTPLLDAIGRAVLHGVDMAVDQRWDRARERAAAPEGDSTAERVRSVTRSFSRELTSLGAAAGATAFAPGLGTAGAVSVVVAEAGWFAFRAADLIMTVGAVYGYTDSTAEERRAWILSILAFGEEAAEEFAALVGAIGITRLARDNSIGSAMAGVVGGDAMTVDALRRVNSRLATHVVARYGSRRGAVTLGKLLPFGIGAVVGGGATWTMARAVAKHCRGFFDRYHLTVAPPPPRPWPSPLPPPPSLPSGTDPS